MEIHENLLSTIGVQRSISSIGLLLLTGFIVWAIFLFDGSNPALLVQEVIVVGIPGLILLYGGYWLDKTDIRADTYIHVAKWCNIGIGTMNGLLALVMLIGSPENIFQQVLMLTGIGGTAGFGIGVNQAKAYTKAREVEERNQELREEQNLRSQIFETSPVGISVVESDGTIRFANNHLAEITGRSKEKIKGLSYNEPMFETTNERGEPVDADSVFKTVLETGEPVYDAERQITSAEGRRIWLLVNAAPILDDSGDVDCVVFAMEDITEHKKLEEELKEFNSLISHDLKNPLVVAENYIDLAKDTQEEEDLRRAAESTRRARRILEELDSIPVSSESLKTYDVSLEECFQQAYKDIDVEINHHVEDTTICASKPNLVRLLSKLVENAVEHNDLGIRIEAGPLENGFYFEDDGKGIQEEEKGKLLERGYTTSETGQGLGLYIVKRIADAHNWYIQVTDSENGGARFEFHT